MISDSLANLSMEQQVGVFALLVTALILAIVVDVKHDEKVSRVRINNLKKQN